MHLDYYTNTVSYTHLDVYKRQAQGLDGLHGEGLYRGQAGLAVLKALEDLLIKMKLEFGIHDFKFLFQHAGAPALSYFFHFIKKRREGQSQIDVYKRQVI